jgi:hypothetical protein
MLDEQLVGDIAADILTDSGRVCAHGVQFASDALQPLDLAGVGWLRFALAVLTSRQELSVTSVYPYDDTFSWLGLRFLARRRDRRGVMLAAT